MIRGPQAVGGGFLDLEVRLGEVSEEVQIQMLTLTYGQALYQTRRCHWDTRPQVTAARSGPEVVEEAVRLYQVGNRGVRLGPRYLDPGRRDQPDLDPP